jgi:16S rRNA G966 N2-methylase RsmD
MDLEPNQLCKDCAASRHVAQLQNTIESLQQQVTQFQEATYVKPELPPRAFVLYRVYCECGQDDRFHLVQAPRKSIFLDPPYRVIGDRKWHLQGHLNAPEKTAFLEQHPDIVLLEYKDYTCKTDAEHFQWQGQVRGTNNLDTTEKKPPSPSSESMLLNSELLSEALSWATAEVQSPGVKPDFSMGKEIRAPYHYIYHTRRALREKLKLMDDEHQIVLGILLEYVEQNFQASYQEANSLFSQGLVSFESLHYLFEPVMNIVHPSDSDTLVYRTNCWLENMIEPKTGKVVGILRCWSWKFDGNFRKRLLNFTMDWPGSRREIIPIKSLCVYPFKYVEPELQEQLFKRGEKFWNCRNRVYVSYDNEEMFGDPVQVMCDFFNNRDVANSID